VKVVVLADKTSTMFCRELERLLRAAPLPFTVADAGFDSWQREIFSPGSTALAEADAILAFVLSPRLVERPDIDQEVAGLLQQLAQQLPARTVLFANFVADPRVAAPLLRQAESTEMVARLNRRLLEFALDHSWFHVVDQAGFCALEGLRGITDARFEASAQMYFSPAGQKRLAAWWYRRLRALLAVPRKVLVTDLDNTLWHGVIGEDGFDGIEMGATEKGWPHQRLQQALLELKARGVLLAVASKNNHDEALRVLSEHPQCLLRPRDFAQLEIGWGAKSTAISRMAKTLNLGRDSFVFLDDSAFERAEVHSALPEVLVLDFPDPAIGLAELLSDETAFDTLSFTREDSQRAASYRAEAERASLRSQASSAEDFYRSLRLRLTIVRATSTQLARIHQLLGKTNQFNLTTERLTQDATRARLSDPRWQTFALQVADKMGDSGLTGLAFVDTADPTHWVVENFLLSCRVIGRTVEHAFVEWLAARARAADVHKLSFRFVPSERNQVARQFLEQSGLSASADERDWSVDIEAALRRLAPHFVTVNYDDDKD